MPAEAISPAGEKRCGQGVLTAPIAEEKDSAASQFLKDHRMVATIYRLVLLTFAIHASCVSTTDGNDYILRIDTLANVVEAASGREPHEATVRSIEVMARPNLSFHGRASMGAETMVLTGKLKPSDNGEFVVELKYEHSVDTGMTVPGENGSIEPLIGKVSVQTAVTIPLDAPLAISGLVMQKKSPGKQLHHGQIRHIVTLTKSELPSD